MAGHSKFANIKHRKARVDAKKGRAFSKHAKLVQSAARQGGGDPAANARLAFAIEKARADNMPKDNIERAIKKGIGELDGGSLDEIRYEGYGPGGVAVIADALTDNRNRTAPEIRRIFELNGGNLGETNSVAWSFDARSLVVISAQGTTEDAATEAALDAGATDLVPEEDEFHVFGEPADLHALRTALEGKGLKVLRAELTMKPKTLVPLDRQNAEKMLALIDALDEHDDVQATFANYDVADDVLKELAGDD